MGVVYKARQKNPEPFRRAEAAAPERVHDAQFAERSRAKRRRFAALNHPNIVTIYDFGQAVHKFHQQEIKSACPKS